MVGKEHNREVNPSYTHLSVEVSSFAAGLFRSAAPDDSVPRFRVYIKDFWVWLRGDGGSPYREPQRQYLSGIMLEDGRGAGRSAIHNISRSTREQRRLSATYQARLYVGYQAEHTASGPGM